MTKQEKSQIEKFNQKHEVKRQNGRFVIRRKKEIKSLHIPSLWAAVSPKEK